MRKIKEKMKAYYEGSDLNKIENQNSNKYISHLRTVILPTKKFKFFNKWAVARTNSLLKDYDYKISKTLKIDINILMLQYTFFSYNIHVPCYK